MLLDWLTGSEHAGLGYFLTCLCTDCIYIFVPLNSRLLAHNN